MAVKRNTQKINIIGRVFGSLTVISEIQQRNKHGHIMYKVVCKCGKRKDVLGASLRANLSRSCNTCYTLTGTHGMHLTKEYRTWTCMKNRCKDINRSRYGGRGISVCERWANSFENFFEDMGKSNGMTLERIDVHGNYEPSNCKWATPKEQARNRTNNVIYTYNGRSMCVSEWCEILNMPSSTFHNRIIRGWSIEKTIKTPVRKFQLKEK